jgi:hypothetical protein
MTNMRVTDAPGFIPGLGTQGTGGPDTIDKPTGMGSAAAANGQAPNVAAVGFGALLQALRNFSPQGGEGAISTPRRSPATSSTSSRWPSRRWARC